MKRILTDMREEQDIERRLNPDFVAPAPCHLPLRAAGLVTPVVAPALCHMPVEVVSVRGSEHPHEERTPSEVVSWTDR